MRKSKNFGFYLPSRDADDVADINQISENFENIDKELFLCRNILPLTGVQPVVSGGGYTYYVYTEWKSFPKQFFFRVPLEYGIGHYPDWGMIIQGEGVRWEATEENFDGWANTSGSYLFFYDNGKVEILKSELTEEDRQSIVQDVIDALPNGDEVSY